jgi:hypothetical protein
LTDRPLNFIAKIPSYVDPANRKAVVDAAKEEIVRKCLLDLKKRPLLETKTEGAGKDSPEVARNKMITTARCESRRNHGN